MTGAQLALKQLTGEMGLLMDLVESAQAEAASLRGQAVEARAQAAERGSKLARLRAALDELDMDVDSTAPSPYRSGARSVLAEIRAVLDS